MAKGKVLIADDDTAVRLALRRFLSESDYHTEEVGTCQELEEAFSVMRPDAALVDYKLPDGNALDLLRRLKKIDPEVPLIVFTGYGTIDLAVRALKEGAENFLTKPVDLSTLLVVLERCIDNHRNRRKQIAYKSSEAVRSIDPFLGHSKAISALAEQAERVMRTESPILIQGETGSGKGVLARWIYNRGPRSDEPFVEMNCAGLSSEFVETELFGHERGAFTGAVNSKRGLLEVAHRGTVFLDEIGDLDPQVQPKLLKVLEEKRFRHLGDTRDRQVDIRLISASNQGLKQLVREKRFRSDLYFRLSTVPLFVPPLRDRIEDLPILARYILSRLCADVGRGEVTLSSSAEKALMLYRWPGNIREFRSVLERALLLSDRKALEMRDLHFDAMDEPGLPANELALTLEQHERHYIERILVVEGWQVGNAARQLGISRSSLYEKIKKHAITLPRSS